MFSATFSHDIWCFRSTLPSTSSHSEPRLYPQQPWGDMNWYIVFFLTWCPYCPYCPRNMVFGVYIYTHYIHIYIIPVSNNITMISICIYISILYLFYIYIWTYILLNYNWYQDLGRCSQPPSACRGARAIWKYSHQFSWF